MKVEKKKFLAALFLLFLHCGDDGRQEEEGLLLSFMGGSEESDATSEQDTSGEATSTSGEETSGTSDVLSAESADTTSEVPECEQIPLVISVDFPKYLFGDYVFDVFVGDGARLYTAMPLSPGAQVVSDGALMVNECAGKVTVQVYNDVNESRTRDAGEPYGEGWVDYERGQEAVQVTVYPGLQLLSATAFRRIAIVYYNPNVPEEMWQLFEDEDFQLLILDNSVFENYPERLQALKQKKPNLILLPYVDLTSVSEFLRSSIEYAKKDLADAAGAYMPGVWNGEPVSMLQYWALSWMLNLTCGVDARDPSFILNLADVYFEYLSVRAIPAGASGGFLDNILKAISWVLVTMRNGVCAFDANYDGVMESVDVECLEGIWGEEVEFDAYGFANMDYAWQEGVTQLLEYIVRLLPSATLVSNECNGLDNYLSYVHGQFCEHATAQNWYTVVSALVKALNQSRGDVSVYHTYCDSDDTVDECNQKSRLVSITGKVVGSYSGTSNNSEYDQPVSPDEDNLEFSLGKRVEVNEPFALSNGAHVGLFENGAVIMNPTGQTLTLDFHRTVYLLPGMQMPHKNTGGAVTQVTLDPGDGIQVYFDVQN